MSDEPDLSIISGDSDPVGDSTTRKVQQLGRIDVPDEYLEQLEVEEGDKVFVVCTKDCVKIVKATADRVLDDA